MPKEIANSVEVIELEAEKILEKAKTRASEMLLEAREEARKILSSPLPLDAVKAEYDRIVSRVRAEADEKIKESEKKAAEIGSNADKKAREITDLMINIVTGKR